MLLTTSELIIHSIPEERQKPGGKGQEARSERREAGGKRGIYTLHSDLIPAPLLRSAVSCQRRELYMVSIHF
jgi:hypothetical protein